MTMGRSRLLKSLAFRALELAGFLLPAFVPTQRLRLCVLMGYFLAHIGGVPVSYKRYKHGSLRP